MLLISSNSYHPTFLRSVAFSSLSLPMHLASQSSISIHSPQWLTFPSLSSFSYIESGSLSQFKAKISSAIILGKEPDASSREREAGRKASDNLRTSLSKIMMRRTQAEILKRLLPPRTDVVVYCGLTPAQHAEYEETSHSLKRSVDATSLCVPVCEVFLARYTACAQLPSVRPYHRNMHLC
jgi:SNF2-related domain